MRARPASASRRAARSVSHRAAPPPRRRAVTASPTSQERLSGLVGKVLDLTRADRGRASLRRERIDLARVGPQLERHVAFPDRMNVHFVQVAEPDEVTVRSWERGSGMTGACGSGACAVCVAGVLTGRSGDSVLAHLPGGDLEVQWLQEPDHIMLTGPAVEVFRGVWRGP